VANSLAGWLERREANFQQLVRLVIYGHRSSPYRLLLEHAGCYHRDLVNLVRREGLEGALEHLYRAGGG
jgi:hypothetical protein